MTYDETLAYIHSTLKFGSKPGLSRIRALMAACQWLDAQVSPTRCFAEAAAAVTQEVAGLCRADGGECPSSRPVSAKSMERYYYAWKGGKKDKRGEKLAETEEDKLEARTDGSDAFDVLCIGAETKPVFQGAGGTTNTYGG